jgi:hypothetical protein
LPGLVAFLGREGVSGRLLDAFALAVAPSGQEVIEEVADGLAASLGEARLGEEGRAAGMVPGDADGHGEGDPVGIDACLSCGLELQGAQCLVNGEEREQFLADQLGRL